MLILQDLKARLEELGARVKTLSRPPESVDAVLVLDLEGSVHRLALGVVERAPYPSQVATLDSRKQGLESVGSPVLVTSYVSEGLASALRESGWSWMDAQGNLDIREGCNFTHQLATFVEVCSRGDELPALKLILGDLASAPEGKHEVTETVVA